MSGRLTRILFSFFILFAVVIGLYPLLYFITDEPGGLLTTKPKELLESVFWRSAFRVHIGFGGMALLAGWPQFVLRWRRTYPDGHRRLGLLCLFSVLFSGSAAVYLAMRATGGWIAQSGFMCLAILWLASTGYAYRHILGGRINLHQKWMILSYALCFAAVSLRIWLPLMNAMSDNFLLSYRVVSWLCWVPNVLIAWLVIIPMASGDRLLFTHE